MAAKILSLLQPVKGFYFSTTWGWEVEDINTQIVTPVDLTGWTSLCMVRSVPGKAGYVLVDSLPITLGGDLGTVKLEIPADTSWDWTWKFGFYDVALYDTVGTPIQFAAGRIEPQEGVSHD